MKLIIIACKNTWRFLSGSLSITAPGSFGISRVVVNQPYFLGQFGGIQVSSKSGLFRFGAGKSGNIIENVFAEKSWVTARGQYQFPVRSIDVMRATVTVGGSHPRSHNMGQLPNFSRYMYCHL